MNETLIIIPARSGSKRIKNKNLRIVKKKPLVYWSIKYAKKYAEIQDIIVSSDSNFIRKIALDEKVKFFKRPKKISKDKSSVYLTIIHVLKKMKGELSYKYVALLQPTSPLRPKNIIKDGIKLLKNNTQFQNLVHLERTNIHTGSISKKNEWKSNYSKINRSQEIINQYRPSGCLFLYSVKDIENFKKFNKRRTYAFVNESDYKTVNIDNEEDFIKLNFLIKKSNIIK